jgi:SAM-dependent methyltransferase
MTTPRDGKSSIFKALRRSVKKLFLRPPVGQVNLGDLDRVRPISENWGFDRGQPLDRHYIDLFLADHAADIRGRVLEIQDDRYTKRFGADQVTRSDILHYGPGNPAATIIADLADGDGIPSDAFDCIVCTQTLNLIFDVSAALETLNRILAPGGVLLATVPAVCRDTPGAKDHFEDYWRFTSASSRRLLEGLFAPSDVQIASYGNVYAAVAFLHGLALEELDVQKLEVHDPKIEVIIGWRAKKESLAAGQ